LPAAEWLEAEHGIDLGGVAGFEMAEPFDVVVKTIADLLDCRFA